MSPHKLVAALQSLPKELQREVAELISFLTKQKAPANRPARRNGVDSARQPFVGMWRDRDDLKDSRGWVRIIRRREWAEE